MNPPYSRKEEVSDSMLCAAAFRNHERMHRRQRTHKAVLLLLCSLIAAALINSML